MHFTFFCFIQHFCGQVCLRNHLCVFRLLQEKCSLVCSKNTFSFQLLAIQESYVDRIFGACQFFQHRVPVVPVMKANLLGSDCSLNQNTNGIFSVVFIQLIGFLCIQFWLAILTVPFIKLQLSHDFTTIRKLGTLQNSHSVLLQEIHIVRVLLVEIHNEILIEAFPCSQS